MEAILSSPSRLRLFYLLHLSKPSSDRVVYREIHRQKPSRIVEVGMGTAQRAERMIQLATEFHSPQDIRYTGVDMFEGRTEANSPGISLREAHCMLKATGVRVQLVPGTPYEGLSRVANSLGKVDLVLLCMDPDSEELRQVCFYLPRLLDENSLVLLKTSTSAEADAPIRPLALSEIEQLAGTLRRRAA
jgi:hypothetical protein